MNAWMEQAPRTTDFMAAELAAAPSFEPRCPCVLCLDVSVSMSCKPIWQLEEGLEVLWQELRRDPVASERVELAIVTFSGEVAVVQDFIRVHECDPPQLTTDLGTYLGTGILQALDLAEARRHELSANRQEFFRPWVLLITDGEPVAEPEGAIVEAERRVHLAEAKDRVCFFAIGVDGANFDCLRRVSVREPKRLRDLAFEELFQWLSDSLGNVSSHGPGAQGRASLPATTRWEAA